MLCYQLPKGNEGVNAELLPFLVTVRFFSNEKGATSLDLAMWPASMLPKTCKS